MMSHLLANNLLSSLQFGFLPGRSSCSQLLTCLFDWLHDLDINKITNVVYTDITKAFDSVSYKKKTFKSPTNIQTNTYASELD